MCHDHAAAGQARVNCRELRHDGLVGQPVEAVAPHTLVMQRLGQCKTLIHGRLADVKRGVETGDLRHPGKGLHRRAYPRQVVRLVQWRQRFEARQLGQHLCIDTHRRAKQRAAMHDAVADGIEGCVVGLVVG